jgi:hypothetical protein
MDVGADCYGGRPLDFRVQYARVEIYGLLVKRGALNRLEGFALTKKLREAHAPAFQEVLGDCFSDNIHEHPELFKRPNF